LQGTPPGFVPLSPRFLSFLSSSLSTPTDPPVYEQNAIGTFLVLFLVPETKGLSLEELDQVFSVPTGVHAKYHLQGLTYHFKKSILRQRMAYRKPLYHWEEKEQQRRYSEKA
jgi:hypothetical protein